MSVEVFILAEFSFGPLTLTSSAVPTTESFDGLSRVYLPTLNKFTLPPVSLDPMSGQAQSGQMTFEFFADQDMAGRILGERLTLQGSDITAWLKYDGKYRLTFEGQVSNASFANDLTTIKIQASRKTQILKKMFPPARILDEGRFVKRRTYRRDSPTNPEESFEIQLLVPCSGIEFRSPFGTPSNPRSIGPGPDTVTYIPLRWEYEPGASSSISEAKLHFDDNQKNTPVPVCYGYHPNPVPVSVAFHYRIRRDTTVLGIPVTNYFKVFIGFLGCHEILGDDLVGTPPYSIGQDYNVRLFQESRYITNGYGFRIGDRSGNTASYITWMIQYNDATFEEQSSASEVDEREFYVKNLRGKPGPGNILLTGLGDVLRDSWNTYGGAGQEYVDWGIINRTSAELNSMEISFLVNSANKNQSLEEILFRRIGGQFPIVFGYPRGRLAWQSRLLDDDRVSIRKAELGVDFIDREDLSETKLEEIKNNLKVSFGVNGVNGNESDSVLFSEQNSEICKSSVDRWGPRPNEELEISDTTSAATATIIGQQTIMLKAGVRLVATYVTSDLGFLDYPPLSIITITDRDAGIFGEDFYLTKTEWTQDFSAIKLSFLSRKMV